MAAPFHGYLETHGDKIAVVPEGDVDVRSAPEFQELISEAEQSRPAAVIIDLRGLTFLDSTGVHLLLRARDRAQSSGYRLVLIRGPETVQHTLDVLNVSKLFEWAADPALVDS
ncbi:MAG: STAS domain-containing protein [Thermoleophilaceae bacterium]